MIPDALRREEYAYLTTTGRATRRPHEIEIWFGATGERIYLISGGGDRSDWVKNLLAQPRARVRLGGEAFDVSARLPLESPDERRAAAALLHDKYGSQVSSTAERWARDAYLVALDLDGSQAPPPRADLPEG